VILTRVREPGAIVGLGMPVYTLSLTETVYVRAYVDESSLGRVVPGDKLIVTTDTSDRQYTGQVGFVSPRAEFTPKSVETPELRTDLVYRLRIVVTDADDSLRQGMPVTITLPPG
jgi:HlyD family secretion protein